MNPSSRLGAPSSRVPSHGGCWSPCLKKATLSTILLVALAAITLGATSFSGAGLNAISADWALAMMVAGGGFAFGAVALLLARRCRANKAPSQSEVENYLMWLENKEMLVHQNGEGKLVISYKAGDRTNNMVFSSFTSPAYLKMCENYSSVSLSDLKEREKII